MNKLLKELKVTKVRDYYGNAVAYDENGKSYFMTYDTLSDMLLTDKEFHVVQKTKRTWIEPIQ